MALLNVPPPPREGIQVEAGLRQQKIEQNSSTYHMMHVEGTVLLGRLWMPFNKGYDDLDKRSVRAD